MIERWNALSPMERRWWTVGGVVFAAFVLMASLNALGRVPGGPALSANSTGHDGLAAWEELLDVNGHPSEQLRVGVSESQLASQATVIAIGQVFTKRETAALRRFVEGGGRLVIGGAEAEPFVRAVTGMRVSWEPEGSHTSRVAIGGEIGLIVGDGFGSWDSPFGVERRVGEGVLVALADPSPLTNAWLDQRDNAWLAVRVAGESGRPVVFAEHGHGYGTATGLGALPARWKAALWFAAVAAIVGALASGKRLGPADPVVDAPPPERVRYVHAVAATLARTKDSEAAVAPLRARARFVLAKRTGRRDVDEAGGLAEAARLVGLSVEDTNALLMPVGDDHDLLALTRVVTQLEEH